MTFNRSEIQVQSQPTGFSSSEEKDLLRKYFDLPLLRQLRKQKDRPLVYFGLPGEKALDVIEWKELIGSVVAVERDKKYLERLEDLLDTQLPDLEYETHWGALDTIIIANRGKKRLIGDQEYRPMLGNHFESSINRYVWRFDVAYLDYCGQFIPDLNPKNPGATLRRAAALRSLFNPDRIDSWHQWILLVTVQAELDDTAQSQIKDYLDNAKSGASVDVCDALDFLLEDTQIPTEEQATRLIHGAASILFSNATLNTSLKIQPRGTVLYRGSEDRAMVHLAFEFTPGQNPLGGYWNLPSLLMAPILRPKDPGNPPWLELLGDQCPGITQESAGSCLNYLETNRVAEILDTLP